MTPEEATAAASRLCAACGMCCDGTLFHIVRMQPTDSVGALNALGLKLKKKKGQNCIEQPCAMFKNMQCSIYAGRPERCRLFECQQLKRLAAGTITEAQAMATIHEARRRVDEVLGLIEQAGHHNLKQPLTVRYDRVMALPLSDEWEPEQVILREELRALMTGLQVLLSLEFKPPLPPIHEESSVQADPVP
ncbi:MAG: YkgJ family cysteine cluster protein [Prosthecobacter sp.]|uniref:YkgJ family cysteine cluster protein n=1 Tax=Prosthecobacter sp. TaxID=1965333 RepID=UPI003901BC7E